MKNQFTILALLLPLFSCKSVNELQTVNELSLDKYAGTWYEIAKLPNRFEKGLTCVSANYTVQGNKKVGVLNRGYIIDKKEWKDINGSAWVPDPRYPGRLKVRFFWPFSGDYYVIALDDKYTYALVGDPSRKYLWILSKNKELAPEIYRKLVNIASNNGFNTALLEKVDHHCE